MEMDSSLSPQMFDPHPLTMEWNGIKVLGLSASLLAGRASRLPQMPPGPGQHTTFKNHNHKGQELSTWVHLPFTGGRASPALGAMQEPIPDLSFNS